MNVQEQEIERGKDRNTSLKKSALYSLCYDQPTLFNILLINFLNFWILLCFRFVFLCCLTKISYRFCILDDLVFLIIVLATSYLFGVDSPSMTSPWKFCSLLSIMLLWPFVIQESRDLLRLTFGWELVSQSYR